MELKKCSKCRKDKPVAEFYYRQTEGRLQAYCKKCLCEHQIERWIQRKKDAITYKGGKCIHCGYSKNYAALEFHHRDPHEKDCDWNKLRLKKWSSIVAELDKCDLLCANCHKEFHYPHASNL